MWLFISEDLTGLLQMGQSTAIVGGYYIQKTKNNKAKRRSCRNVVSAEIGLGNNFRWCSGNASSLGGVTRRQWTSARYCMWRDLHIATMTIIYINYTVKVLMIIIVLMLLMLLMCIIIFILLIESIALILSTLLFPSLQCRLATLNIYNRPG